MMSLSFSPLRFRAPVGCITFPRPVSYPVKVIGGWEIGGVEAALLGVPVTFSSRIPTVLNPIQISVSHTVVISGDDGGRCSTY